MGGLFSDFGAVFDGNAPRRSLAHTSNLITPVAAKEQKRALRVQQQQGQHSADLAWSHAAAQRQAHQTYVNSMRGQPPSNYFAGMSTTSAQAMYAQYYQQYPAHYYQAGSEAYAAAAQGASEGETPAAPAPAATEGDEATAEQQAAAAQALLHPYMMLSPEQQQVMQAQYLAAYGYTAQAPAEAEAPTAEGAAPAAAAAASEPPAEAPPESLEPLAA